MMSKIYPTIVDPCQQLYNWDVRDLGRGKVSHVSIWTRLFVRLSPNTLLFHFVGGREFYTARLLCLV